MQGPDSSINVTVENESLLTSYVDAKTGENFKYLTASGASQSVADESIVRSCKNLTLDLNAFNAKHGSTIKKCYEPEKIAKKLLLRLLDIY
jgi:hypothetical protein